MISSLAMMILGGLLCVRLCAAKIGLPRIIGMLLQAL